MWWKRTSRKLYWFNLEQLPPAYQDGYGFLVGEPMDHDWCAITGTVLPRYDAFVQKNGLFYASRRPITIPEYKVYVPQLIARGQ